MSEENKAVDQELIDFLEGKDSPNFVTSVITDDNTNKAFLVIDENNEKKVKVVTYEPFLFMKELTGELKKRFYKNDVNYKRKAMEKHGISFAKLRTTNKYGEVVKRLDDGYKYIVKSTKSYQAILDFFKEGGVGGWSKMEDGSKIFFNIKTNEQVMIQKGIKLFKGFDLYNNVHRMVFDIETTGLLPSEHRIFLVGVRDNRGFHKVLEVNKVDDDESERKVIIEFFNDIVRVKPSIIYGYNSENFDFNFFIQRAKILGVDLSKILTITRTKASIKFGGETENYEQTNLLIDGEFYCNVIDTLHAVRRAKAINSDIKATGLKYITKFSKANKPDRMYVDGNSIYKIWNENKHYLINPTNNEYVKILDDLQHLITEDPENSLLCKFKEKHSDKPNIITGKEIVFQYLLDDLWETEKVDSIYNESSFMVSKWLSTSFVRTCVIGGASSWNLIMTDWSYKNRLAIPIEIKKQEMVGGISRTFMLGTLVLNEGEFIKKTDFAGLYPTIQLEYDIFPNTDITNILYRLLKYFKETRDIYKYLATSDPDENKRVLYKTKQLPLKIFNNSNFGANSSEYFQWADIANVGERITCTGRQYLRKMTYFMWERGLKPAVIDTDGLNLLMPHLFEYDLDGNKLPEPVTADYFTYTNSKGKEFKGCDCFVAKFNDVMNHKYIKVDDDGQWENSLNLARKNYVSYEIEIDKKEKIKKLKMKMVGNSIKSSSLPKYVEEFLDKGIKMILQNKPKEFVDLYYDTFNNVYYNEIPASAIASKAKVKMNLKTYVAKIHLPNLIKTLFYFKDFETFTKEHGKYLKYGKNEDFKRLYKVPTYRYKEQIQQLIKKGYINTELPDVFKSALNSINNYASFDEWYEYHIDKFGLKTEEGFTEFMSGVIMPYFMEHGNKKGQPKPKQAHMELLIENGMDSPDLGEILYYINTGSSKTETNAKRDKDGNMLCRLVDSDKLDEIIEYNKELYADFFNGKLKPLLVCFKQHLAENLLIKYETTETIDNSGKKPKKIKTKGFNPNNRKYFTEEEMQLTNWTYETYPYEKKDIDSLFEGGVNNVPLFQMEDREMDFWNKIQIDPSIIFDKFTCNIPYKKVDDYYDIYKRVRENCLKHGFVLKIEKQKHENDDLVLRKIGEEYWVCVYNDEKYKKVQQVTAKNEN